MRKILIFILAVLVFVNCTTTSKSTKTPLQRVPINLLGNFKDDYGISYTVTDSIWIQHPNITYHILNYDSAGQYFIARNDNGNPSEAGLYSRIDIMYFSNMEPWIWGFCLTAYKAKDPKEAVATQSADRNNPKKGCGGFPFSRLKRN